MAKTAEQLAKQAEYEPITTVNALCQRYWRSPTPALRKRRKWPNPKPIHLATD